MEFEVPLWNQKNSFIKTWCLGALVVSAGFMSATRW